MLDNNIFMQYAPIFDLFVFLSDMSVSNFDARTSVLVDELRLLCQSQCSTGIHFIDLERIKGI